MTTAIATALGNLRRNDLLTDAQVKAGIAALAAPPASTPSSAPTPIRGAGRRCASLPGTPPAETSTA